MIPFCHKTIATKMIGKSVASQDEYSYANANRHVTSNGWGASAIDAFSTAVVMENSEAMQQILDHVQNIDFDTAVGSISLFETTIRYLGGLLSGKRPGQV